MDWSSGLKLRAFIGGLCLFLFSGYLSCQEVKYGLLSKRATAKITRIDEYEDNGGRNPKLKTAVEYEFTDDHGEARKGKDTFVGRIDAERGDELAVQYRGGSNGDSRVAGHANTTAIYLFIFCLLLLAALSYPIVREVYQEVYAPKKRTR